MNPLQTNQRVFTWLSVCPVAETASKWERISVIVFAWSVFAANLSAVASSFAFFMKYAAVDLEECLYALMQIALSSNMSYALFMAIISRQNINGIFQKLAKLYHTSKNNSIYSQIICLN